MTAVVKTVAACPFWCVMTVAPLLWRLPARERRMLALRFYGNLTQREIAEEMGVSQMHVSRLLSRALGWLREAMLSDHTPEWRGVEADEIRVRVDRHDTVITVRGRGEIERDTAGRLRDQLHGALACATARRVVVDLSGVSLLDAAGIAVLQDAVHTSEAGGVELRIAGARPYVERVLTIAGTAHRMAREARDCRNGTVAERRKGDGGIERHVAGQAERQRPDAGQCARGHPGAEGCD